MTRPAFHTAAGSSSPATSKRKRPAPLSIRLSEAERAQLVRQAKGQPLGRYVKTVLFAQTSDGAVSRTVAENNSAMLAQLLAALGASGIGEGLTALAESLEYSTLGGEDEIATALHHACAEVAGFRHTLVSALGLKAV